MSNGEELRDFTDRCLSLNKGILELASQEKDDEIWMSVMQYHIARILKSQIDPRGAYDQFKTVLEEDMEVMDA